MTTWPIFVTALSLYALLVSLRCVMIAQHAQMLVDFTADLNSREIAEGYLEDTDKDRYAIRWDIVEAWFSDWGLRFNPLRSIADESYNTRREIMRLRP